MSVNKRSQARVQGSWAAAGSQQKPHGKSGAKPASATDAGKPTFQPSERVSRPHLLQSILVFSIVVIFVHIYYYYYFHLRAIFPDKAGSVSFPLVLLLHLFQNRTSGNYWKRVFTGHLSFLPCNHQYQSADGNTKRQL